MRNLIVMIFFALFHLHGGVQARVIHVDDDAPNDPGPGDLNISDPLEDGSTEHPFDAIQEAIVAAVNFDTVLVADGTYTGHDNTDLSHRGKTVAVMSENGPQHCIIDCEENYGGFFFQLEEDENAVVQGFWIKNGAIRCQFSSPTIVNNIIENFSNIGSGIVIQGRAGNIPTSLIKDNIIRGFDYMGIHCYMADPIIIGNRLENNASATMGGGIGCYLSDPTIKNNLFIGNSARLGGAIGYNDGAEIVIENNTIVNNSATEFGGGIICFGDCHATIINNILWDNHAPTGGEICVGHSLSGSPTRATVLYSDVQGGQSSVYVRPGSSLEWGQGMINADPLFVPASGGEFYLSHADAGQSSTSPCVNSGSASAASLELDDKTTRTDEVADAGLVDMGFHYLRWQPGEDWDFIVTGPGPGPNNPPLVRTSQAQWTAYGVLKFGVNVVCGDMDNSGLDEVITGPGPGPQFGPHVRGWRLNGTSVGGLSFLAYGTNKFGVNVACGDIDNDDYDEIITGAGPGAVFGPHVRAWNYDNSGSVSSIPGISYFAYGTNKYGVNVSSGDIDGDGYDEIITGAGPGAVFGPHVRGWNCDGTNTASAIPAVSFLAYGTNKWGVKVACGDFDADGMDEIITSPGPSQAFGAHIRGWNYDGGSLSAMPEINFFAYNSRFGAEISAGDVDDDGFDEILTMPGPDPSAYARVRAWNVDGGTASLIGAIDFYAYDYTVTHGGKIAGGHLH